LSDLHIATPLSLVDIVSDWNCSATPVTITAWRTAYLSGNPYPADPYLLIMTDQEVNTLFHTYSFPGLLLTLLKPGDIITVVIPISLVVVLKAD
jgi:hypothetical protein